MGIEAMTRLGEHFSVRQWAVTILVRTVTIL
jgi:hypothetical protein